MKRIINIMLFGRNKSNIAVVSLSVIGLYIGFLFWYLIVNYLKQPAASCFVLAVSILVTANVLLGLYQIPEQLCTNPSIEKLLYFPVRTSKIIYAVICRLFKIQVLLCLSFILPSVYFFDTEILLLISSVLICILLLMILNLLIFSIAVCISSISKKICGYLIVGLQYGGFLLIVELGLHLLLKFFENPLLLYNIYACFENNYIFISLILLIILLLCFIMIAGLSKTHYPKSYYYLAAFTKPIPKFKVRRIFAKNPYFLIEWCRVVRNKELFFYSSIKSIITVYLLANILLKRLAGNDMTAQNVSDIFFMVLCCAINTVSSTSYSSDKNLVYYRLFPIDYTKIFFSKVIVSFLWNEIIVISVWLVRGISVLISLDIYLLIYGTFTNLLCSFMGVYFDYKMPRNINSPNALLHGNMSKVFVLLTSTGLTVLEIYFLQKSNFVDVLIGISAINIMFAILAGIMILFAKGGVRHDRS